MTKQLPALYALRAFESVVRLGSATLAAGELGVTQSAISKHIKNLEAYFGCQLFVRSGPKMEVTEPGRILGSDLKQGFKQIEEACSIFRNGRSILRLKAPSTLTMRWLLSCLSLFRETRPGFEVKISSVWMDIDTVDFFSEPYDCAILLGAGRFGDMTSHAKLFDEWLIPICAPTLFQHGPMRLADHDLIHPSPDRRDWRRWLKAVGMKDDVDITNGQTFDTLEQGNMAAIAGHGISIGDLVMCADAIVNKQLVLPFQTAVQTGDGYHMVWPEDSRKIQFIKQFLIFLQARVPPIDNLGIASFR